MNQIISVYKKRYKWSDKCTNTFHSFIKLNNIPYVHIGILCELFSKIYCDEHNKRDLNEVKRIFGQSKFIRLNPQEKKPKYIDWNIAKTKLPFIKKGFSYKTNMTQYIKNNIDEILTSIQIANSYIKSNNFKYVSKSKFYKIKNNILKHIIINYPDIVDSINIEIDKNNKLFYSLIIRTEKQQYQFHQIFNNDNRIYENYINYDTFHIGEYKEGNHTEHMNNSSEEIEILTQKLAFIRIMLAIQ